MKVILPLLCLATVACAAPAAKPLVESNKLRRLLKKSELHKKAVFLQDIADRNGGNRKWGSKGHWETITWIHDTLAETGYYDVEYQYFNISHSAWDRISVTISDGTVPALQIGFQGGVSGTVTGPMVYVPNLGCSAKDYPDITGKIAFLQRGTCTQGQKNAYAKAAGAIGVVSYNNDSPVPDPPTLGVPAAVNVTSFIPGIFIDKATGEALLAKIQAGTALTATIDGLVNNVDILTANVLAETKEGNHNQVISAGAHSDSVKAGPGINDDGSGAITQLEIALQLTKFSVKNAVRWMWWSAEEDGLLGSLYYTDHLTDTEAGKLVMNMDFDMLASNNYAYLIYNATAGPSGSPQLETTFRSYFVEQGIKTFAKEFNGRSDYVGFINRGIAAGGIATGSDGIKTVEQQQLFGGEAGKQFDTCYHQACDRVDELAMGAWIQNSKCVAHAISTYARSIEGFPFPRKSSAHRVAGYVPHISGSMMPSNVADEVDEY